MMDDGALAVEGAGGEASVLRKCIVYFWDPDLKVLILKLWEKKVDDHSLILM